MTRPDIRYLCPLLTVFDMQTSLGFYRDLLGFEIVDQDRPGDDCSWVWLKFGDTNLMLNDKHEPQHRPEAPNPSDVAAHQDTGLYLGTDVEAMYTYLTEQGVECGPPEVRPYGAKHLNVSDPDGYHICFQCMVDPDEAPE